MRVTSNRGERSQSCSSRRPTESRGLGLLRYITPIVEHEVENKMENDMEHEMETGGIWGLYGLGFRALGI